MEAAKEEDNMERTIKPVQFPARQPKLLRVAAYARVSTGKDAMLHSLSAQVSFYSSLIQSHGDWLYAGVYTDEAITGTKDQRDGFQQMLADCCARKIDMVITKSISRFARNTVTLLKTVRELKALGVDVFFEEQNLHTMSADGELMLTILASYAQEESLSASENQKWRIRKGFEQGELINLRYLFGYQISNGRVEIDPAHAEIVREVFHRVLAGESFSAISRDLNQRKIARELDGKWNVTNIRALLSNEKYTGSALLQKHFRNNHLEKKKTKNTGELPQFYAEETHPAIIDMDTFQKTQELLLKLETKRAGYKKAKTSVFTGRIVCGICGAHFKRVTVHGKPGWNCSTFQTKGKSACSARKIPEDILKEVLAKLMGTPQFDEEAFAQQIHHLEVPEHYHLRAVFQDGHTAEAVWQHRSRRESWTPEMRKIAAEHAKKQRRVAECQE